MANRQRADSDFTGGQPAAGSRAARAAARNSERARRNRVRRRRRHRIFFTVICVVLVLAAAISATTVFFRVSTVTVAGDTRYSQQELAAASGVQEGDNLILLDTRGITNSLMASCPYLKEVKLHRRLPSTLQLEVSDRVPILSVENDGNYLLLDDEGKVVDSVGMVQENTAEVVGADTAELGVGMTVDDDYEKLMTVLDMMTLLTKYELNGEIVSIDISKAYDVRIQYEDRYTVMLGNMDELEHKVQFLTAILKEPSLPESGVIDLTDDSEARYRPATDSTESVKLDVDQDETTAEDAQTETDTGEETDAAEDESTDTADTQTDEEAQADTEDGASEEAAESAEEESAADTAEDDAAA